MTSGGTPYAGSPLLIPDSIQAEDFDNGGERRRLPRHDLGQRGRLLQNVGWTQVGEWLEYTVSVAATDNYKIEVIAATPLSTGSVHVEIDGANVTGNMPLPNTGGWGTYAAASKSGVLLTAGTHVMRVSIDGYGFLLDRVQVTGDSFSQTAI